MPPFSHVQLLSQEGSAAFSAASYVAGMLQAACLARCNGAGADMWRHGEEGLEAFRERVRTSCSSTSQHMIVSYSRRGLSQTGDHQCFQSACPTTADRGQGVWAVSLLSAKTLGWLEAATEVSFTI